MPMLPNPYCSVFACGFAFCPAQRYSDESGEIVNVTGILLDYRQTFFSLNRNTEEIFHFARAIKLSMHFTRFIRILYTG
ncbi:hypothetical protein AGH21_20795 [Klebsiella oxytoca]|nr:hypothetical protein AGH21_20795 [Klebsiella oxytoca]